MLEIGLRVTGKVREHEGHKKSLMVEILHIEPATVLQAAE
jgi:hypothetical protein